MAKNKRNNVEGTGGRYSRLAVWSLVLALLVWTVPKLFVFEPLTDVIASELFWPFVFIWFAIPALSVIFGIVALVKIKKNKSLRGKALAIIGIVIGGLDLLGLLFAVLFIGPSWF